MTHKGCRVVKLQHNQYLLFNCISVLRTTLEVVLLSTWIRQNLAQEQMPIVS